MTTALLTRPCQNDEFTTSAMVTALEQAWTAIRIRHAEVPAVVLVLGSGTTGRSARSADTLLLGHFAPLRWQHGESRLPEVLVSGEGLTRTPDQVLTTLLHEAAHGLAHVRGIKDTSRQGRWHNKHFATLATELGLTPAKDNKIGWSPCTLRPETATTYAPELAALTAAMSAYRHHETRPDPKPKKPSTSVTCECGCGRQIRLSRTDYEAGPITCSLCDSSFLPDDTDGDPR